MDTREFEGCSQYKLITDREYGWGHEDEKGVAEIIPLFIGLDNKGMVGLPTEKEGRADLESSCRGDGEKSALFIKFEMFSEPSDLYN